MFRSLTLHNVGPATDLELGPLAPRLNILAGDNGLGKTFLLDALWYTMTVSWAGEPARPRPGVGPQASDKVGGERYLDASITARLSTTGKSSRSHRYAYHREHGEWYSINAVASNAESHRLEESPHPGDGIVVYARVDGGISLWDCYRNAGRTKAPIEGKQRPRAFHFTAQQVWDKTDWCNGLISDWVLWQGRGDKAFDHLVRLLSVLQPSVHEALKPGTPRRVSMDDPREIPTVVMPYGDEVPVTHLSAAYRRIIGLAYVLVWAWREHLIACELMAEKPARELTFLIDEIEAHLHPRWQRTILRALTEVVSSLTVNSSGPAPQLQVIASTHSPLVLASLEPLYDEREDAVWELDLVDNEVKLSRYQWARRGDVSAWLTSKVFDMDSARSLEAERAIDEAMALARSDQPEEADIRRATEALRAVLSDTDRLWLRWSAFARDHGVDT